MNAKFLSTTLVGNMIVSAGLISQCQLNLSHLKMYSSSTRKCAFRATLSNFIIQEVPSSKWSMKWEKKLRFIDISYRFIVQLSMNYKSLHHPRGSGGQIWLISETGAVLFSSSEMWKLRHNFFALDNCTVLLSKLATCSAHRVTDRHTEGCGCKIHGPIYP